ncbi:MAG: hypothetical protein K940chlam3_00487 [Chlamydiae bacterium]|nr:hypothetical protein [Chlamydiota bacterium]
MSTFFSQLFSENWQRKLIALVLALITWWFINQSIIETKTLVGVPIRIVNLPINKTIEGLLPNGILSRRATLTVSGSKKVIEILEPGDLEVILDAGNAPNEWLVQVGKLNLVSLNPNIDLTNGIKSVSSQEFVIKLSKLITAKIPIKVETPVGHLPHSYMLMGIWPLHLEQTVSGPEEQVEKLKIEGLELTFNLNDISKAELNRLNTPKKGTYSTDVIDFPIPDSWKKVYIPFMNHPWQQINDPKAENMWIEFLRKTFIPIEHFLPVDVFFPFKNNDTINPDIYKLSSDGLIQDKNGIPYLNRQLFAYEVSQLFMETVKDFMQVSIIALPKNEEKHLRWSVEFMQPQTLENRYIAYLENQFREHSSQNRSPSKELEETWRNRFRQFMQTLRLYKSRRQQLELNIDYDNENIVVEEKQ